MLPVDAFRSTIALHTFDHDRPRSSTAHVLETRSMYHVGIDERRGKQHHVVRKILQPRAPPSIQRDTRHQGVLQIDSHDDGNDIEDTIG
jgi:hypothetical protein